MSDRATLENTLRGYSRYGEMSDRFGGLRIVSKTLGPLRVRVSYQEHKVWLQERPGSAAIQLELGRRTEDRRSTGTRDWQKAVEFADRQIAEMAMRDHIDTKVHQQRRTTKATGVGATLQVIEDLFTRLQDDKAPENAMTDNYRRTLSRILAILKLKYGPQWRPSEDMESPAAFVRWYLDIRTQVRIVFPKAWKRRSSGPVIERTAISELKDFGHVLMIAEDDGIIPVNPLARFSYAAYLPSGDAGVPEHREEVSLDWVQLLLTPPVDPSTGRPLLGPDGKPLAAPVRRTQATDGGARLEYLVKLLSRMGRRVSDFLGTTRGGVRFYPTIGDLAFTLPEIRAVLAAAPNHRTRWARTFASNGAFVANRNKTSTHRILPLSRYVRLATEEWLAVHPARDNPAAPLICSITDPMKPLWPNLAYKWLLRAEDEARNDAERMGLDAEDVIPKREGSAFHGLRPMWRTLMTELGWDLGADETIGQQLKVPGLNKHVLFYGGWTLGTGTAQARIYSRLIPEHLVAAAELISAVRVMALTSVEAEQRVTRTFGEPDTSVLDVLAARSTANHGSRRLDAAG
jgi:hypothetical protein